MCVVNKKPSISLDIFSSVYSVEIPFCLSKYSVLGVYILFFSCGFLHMSTRFVSSLSQVSAVERLHLHLMYHATPFVPVNICILVGRDVVSTVLRGNKQHPCWTLTL